MINRYLDAKYNPRLISYFLHQPDILHVINMLMHSLNFRCFVIVLRLSLLIAFVNNRYALAINTGPNEESPGNPGVPAEPPRDPRVQEEPPAAPEVPSYPSIDDIRTNLRSTAGKITVVCAITEPENLAAFFGYTRQQGYVSIFNAFPRGYVKRKRPDDEVSNALYKQFYDLCNIEYLKAAQGNVKVMTDDGKVPGPGNCGYFVNRKADFLRANQLVKTVDFVKATDPSVHTR